MHEGWQTSGIAKVVRIAFNLYCNGTPSVDDEQDTEEQVDECRRYSVEDLSLIHIYQEHFFEMAQKADLTNAVIALSGVAGLNAAEHLRSLCPACRMIWCSDLDFSGV